MSANAEPHPPDLSEVVDNVVSRLMSGQPVDVESLCARDPHLREQLEAVLPAVEAMAAFGTMSAAGDRQSPEVVSPPPQELGDFRIVREIGRGGMGVVYEAEQLSLRRRVAFKVLPYASVLDPRQLQRFKNEAQAAASIKHPHIVSVIAVDCERGVYFYAMELIEGQSLAEVIEAIGKSEGKNKSEIGSRRSEQSSEAHTEVRIHSDFRRPTSDFDTASIAALSTQRTHHRRGFYCSVARLGFQAAEALEYAHQCGIVHRDIKPSNLLIDRNAQLWVTDFGLAMSQGGDGLTLTGDLIGTLRYMSPEQAAGNWAAVDHRTDIYSLGASLYELLTLHPAFAGRDRQALLRKIDEKDAPRPRRVDGSIPRDLETIVMKAMAKEPRARYASAGELAQDLQRFIELKPIRARRSTRAHKLSRWAKRNPTLAVATSIATLLIALLAIGGPFVATRQAGLARRLEVQLYEVQIERAYRAVLNHEFTQADRILRRCVPTFGRRDQRGFEWYYLWRSCQQVLNVPTLTYGLTTRASYSPDGRYLALGTWDGVVAVHDAESLDLVWQQPNVTDPEDTVGIAHTDQVNDLVFSHDSDLLVTASRDRTLKVWSVATGSLLESRPFEKEISSLSISPGEGQMLAIGFTQPDQASREPVEISFWSLDRSSSGLTLTSLDVTCGGLVGLVRKLAFSADGSRLAACCSDNRIRIWNVNPLRPLPLLGGHSGVVFDVEFSPHDGNLLASASAGYRSEEGGGEVKLWDIRAGAEIATLHENTQARCIAFSKVASHLAVGDHDGLVRLWSVNDAESVQLVSEFPGHERSINDIDFSRSGEFMLTASADETVKIWNQTRLRDEPTRIVEHGASVLRLASSHDSRLLVSAGDDSFAKLWDVQTGKLIDRIEPEGRVEYLRAAAFSPDDKLIALGGGPWGQSGPMEFFVWDPLTQQKRVLFSGDSSDATRIINTAVFSPDGAWVAAGIAKNIHIWNVRTGQPWKELQGHTANVHGLAWPAATNQITSLAWGPTLELNLWDGKFGQPGGAFFVPKVGSLTELTLSPDGQEIAVGTDNGDVLLFDVTTRRFVKRLVGHTEMVLDLDFSPDGRRLATASRDRTVKVWNLATETPLLTFREPHGYVWSVCFSPDGRALFAADDVLENSVIYIWRASTPEEAQIQLDTRRPVRGTATSVARRASGTAP